MESPAPRMQSLGRSVLLEQPDPHVDEMLARIDAVDREAVDGRRAAVLRPAVVDGLHRPGAGAVPGRRPATSTWEER